MPRTKQQFEEIRAEKKKLIMDVALELFASQGYASTSISQIAQRAGISKGLMYNYFESKEALIKTVLVTFVEDMIEVMDPNHDGEIDDDEALQYFDFVFDLFKNRREELKLYFQLSFQPEVMTFFKDSSILEKSNKYRNMFSDYFFKKYPGNPYLTMLNLSAILKGFSMQYVYAPELFPDNVFIAYREYLKDMFVRQKN